MAPVKASVARLVRERDSDHRGPVTPTLNCHSRSQNALVERRRARKTPDIEKMEREIPMLYQVKDLSPERKQAAEILLGHPVSDDEVVSIKSLGPSTIIPSKLSPEERVEALRALNERFAKGVRPDVSEDEEASVANEALRSARPNYRPII